LSWKVMSISLIMYKLNSRFIVVMYPRWPSLAKSINISKPKIYLSDRFKQVQYNFGIKIFPDNDSSKRVRFMKGNTSKAQSLIRKLYLYHINIVFFQWSHLKRLKHLKHSTINILFIIDKKNTTLYLNYIMWWGLS